MTNYEAYKEQLIKLASLGSFCGTCIARKECNKSKDEKQKGSDTFCEQIFLSWSKQQYKGKKN